MSPYAAPVKDILFAMRVAGLDEVAGARELSGDVVASILEEAGRFAAEVLAPLNTSGDRVGSCCNDGVVSTPPGFKEAYRSFVQAGWPTVAASPEFGGQGLPLIVSSALNEIWSSANLGFSLCPLANEHAAEAIVRHGSAPLRSLYVPRIVKGEWGAPMCLTESQAGSDLAAIRARAIPQGDHYRITGNKIFITYGEHDLTDNIVHLVLARLPDAPAGTAGISLFLVPKFMVAADGSLGTRNDWRCVSLEHKLGIHASPTAVIAYGERAEGAIGFLVGDPNRGMQAMFTMMNRMRLGIGNQAVAMSERAYQQARNFARERVQGHALKRVHNQPPGSDASVPIIRHEDVRRMLLTIRAETEAMRSLASYAAAQLDLAEGTGAKRAEAQLRADLLTPVVKGWTSEEAQSLVSLGVQVHGGAGYIEETGAAQLLRDTRILSIFEATTGIQALDLVRRKLARDEGKSMHALLTDMRDTADRCKSAGDPLRGLGESLDQAADLLAAVTRRVLEETRSSIESVAAVSVPYLMLVGTVCGDWMMTRAALLAAQKLAQNEDPEFHRAKLLTARFYADHVTPRAHGYAHEVLFGAPSTLELDEEAF